MLHVWYALSPPPLRECLDRAEQVRCARLRFAQDRRHFAQAHSLKRVVLSGYAPAVAPQEWRFAHGKYGKPAVVQQLPYCFNLSHSGSAVALAVAAAEVGVDIERCRSMPHLEGLARLMFHPDEQRWLWAGSAVEMRFFRLWTCKEALLKAAGTGFSYPSRRFYCEALDSPDGAVASLADSRWRCFTRYAGGFALSVAVPYDCPTADMRFFCVENAPQPTACLDRTLPVLAELRRYLRPADGVAATDVQRFDDVLG